MKSETMDFFAAQAKAIKNTTFLVTFFVAGALLTGVLLYYLIILLEGIKNWSELDQFQVETWWDPQIFKICVISTTIFIVLATLWKTSQTLGPGSKVATMLGGKKIYRKDKEYSKILNVVEEMALASGMPVPDIYIIDDPTINAFAAGSNPDNAVIGFTTSCLRSCSRDELQAVAAHEFSHIRYRDIRLNSFLLSVVFGLSCIAIIGRELLYASSRKDHNNYSSSSDSNKKGDGGAIVALAMWITGSVGYIVASVLSSAISRQREYLADASAVQFTRNPEAMKSLLMRIGKMHTFQKNKTSALKQQEASHMFFSSLNTSILRSLFDTHPPILKRIQRIDSGFQAVAPQGEKVQSTNKGRFSKSPISMLNTSSSDQRSDTEQTATEPCKSIAIIRKRIQQIPKTLRDAAQETSGAFAISCALLLSRQDTNLRAEQKSILTRFNAPDFQISEWVREVEAEVNALESKLLYPLAELCVPALRDMSLAQYKVFDEITACLVNSDREVDLFEFCLQQMWRRALGENFEALKSADRVRIFKTRRVLREINLVLSAIAHTGSLELSSAQKAFELGANNFNAGKTSILSQINAREACSILSLEAAIDKLRLCSDPIKQQIVNAASIIISADDYHSSSETELFRALGYCLGLPQPLTEPDTGM